MFAAYAKEIEKDQLSHLQQVHRAVLESRANRLHTHKRGVFRGERLNPGDDLQKRSFGVSLAKTHIVVSVVLVDGKVARVHALGKTPECSQCHLLLLATDLAENLHLAL